MPISRQLHPLKLICDFYLIAIDGRIFLLIGPWWLGIRRFGENGEPLGNKRRNLG